MSSDPAITPGAFDSILLAQEIEHMGRADAKLWCGRTCRMGGQMERCSSYVAGAALRERSDAHLVCNSVRIHRAVRACLAQTRKILELPVPRWAGRPFIFNEFCVKATKPSGPSAPSRHLNQVSRDDEAVADPPPLRDEADQRERCSYDHPLP